MHRFSLFTTFRLFDHDELVNDHKKCDELLKKKENKMTSLEQQLQSFETKHMDLELE